MRRPPVGCRRTAHFRAQQKSCRARAKTPVQSSRAWTTLIGHSDSPDRRVALPWSMRGHYGAARNPGILCGPPGIRGHEGSGAALSRYPAPAAARSLPQPTRPRACRRHAPARGRKHARARIALPGRGIERNAPGVAIPRASVLAALTRRASASASPKCFVTLQTIIDSNR